MRVHILALCTHSVSLGKTDGKSGSGTHELMVEILRTDQITKIIIKFPSLIAC